MDAVGTQNSYVLVSLIDWPTSYPAEIDLTFELILDTSSSSETEEGSSTSETGFESGLEAPTDDAI